MSKVTRRILVIGPAWVGDTVMAQSLFKLLKQRDPQVMIDVLAPAWTFALLSRMPEVSQAIEMPLTHGEFKLATRYQLGKKLRAAAYDQALVLPNSFKSALIPWFARIPQRTGWVGECRYGLLNDIRRLDKKRYPLMVEQFVALGLLPHEALLATLPQPQLKISMASQQAVLAKHQLMSERPVLALCAGAEFGPSKRWPEHYYADVANHMLDQGWSVWLFGSLKDSAVTNKIMQLTGDRCENLAGKLGLSETVDLLSLAKGVVTNDSGLLHVASALDKEVVAIYGSTSPTFTPPLSDRALTLKLDLDCQPCFARICPLQHHRCMQDLLPQRVLSVITSWGA